MSIFRVEKNKNYTVISNYHLRDKNLSLRTIGLLSIILSLPEDWDYSQAGLAAIVKDGVDSVRSGIQELEKYGYLERERERDENGRMRGTIYRVYETPKDKRDELTTTKTYGAGESDKNNQEQSSPKVDEPTSDSPILENPTLVNPRLETPTLDEPTLGTTRQLSKDILNTDLSNKDLPSKDKQNTDSTNQSIYQSNNHDDRTMDGPNDSEYREALEEIIKSNVGYSLFERKIQSLEEQLDSGAIDLFDYDNAAMTYNLKTVNQVVDYMLDILTSLNNDPIKIGDELISRNMVKAKLHKVDFVKMKRVVFELNTNMTIKNPKKYAISMLYNS